MTTIQVRDVPEETSRLLKARAAGRGQSLSEYLLGELVVLAARPTLDELTLRVQARGSVGGPPATELLDAARAGRS